MDARIDQGCLMFARHWAWPTDLRVMLMERREDMLAAYTGGQGGAVYRDLRMDYDRRGVRVWWGDLWKPEPDWRGTWCEALDIAADHLGLAVKQLSLL